MLFRSRLLAFVLVVGVASVVTPTVAIADSSTRVTFVDAYAPAAGVAVPLHVCVDGVTTASLTTAVKGGPFPIAAGNHLVAAYEGSTTCSGTPTISSTVRLPAVAAATVVLGWGPAGPSIVVYPESPVCVPAGDARLVLRNAGDVSSAPSIWGARSGSDQSVALTPTAAYGHQASVTVRAGTFTDVAARAGATVLTNFGTTTLAAGTVTQVYLYGGAHGAAGAFSFTFPLTTCAPVTTSPQGTTQPHVPPSSGSLSTEPRISSEPAPAAIAIHANKAPTYIG